MQVAENIQNPNTDATTKREITVKVKFEPNKNRQWVKTTISVTTKLAPTEAIDTEMIMGTNMKTGEVEIAEYDGQILGQTSLASYAEPVPAEEPEAEQPQEQKPTSKPLDLRNRGKKQEPELVAGRDYDPETGEVYETAGQVVAINKAAQA